MLDFSDPALDDFVAVRSVLSREQRLSFPHPIIRNRWDAFLLAFHISRQDVPVFFWIGIIATGAMATHVLIRVVMFLFRSLGKW